MFRVQDKEDINTDQFPIVAEGRTCTPSVDDVAPPSRPDTLPWCTGASADAEASSQRKIENIGKDYKEYFKTPVQARVFTKTSGL